MEQTGSIVRPSIASVIADAWHLAIVFPALRFTGIYEVAFFPQEYSAEKP